MNFWRRHESARATAPLNHAFLLETSQRMPRRHQAHVVDLRQLSLRIDRVPGFQLSGFNAFQDCALYSPISWGPVSAVL